jgi:hypothetical protein
MQLDLASTNWAPCALRSCANSLTCVVWQGVWTHAFGMAKSLAKSPQTQKEKETVSALISNSISEDQ